MYFHVTDGNQSDKGFAVLQHCSFCLLVQKPSTVSTVYISLPFPLRCAYPEGNDSTVFVAMFPTLSGILTFHFIIVVKKIKIKNLCYYTERSSLPFSLWLHSLVVTPSHFCGCLSLPFLWNACTGKPETNLLVWSTEAHMAIHLIHWKWFELNWWSAWTCSFRARLRYGFVDSDPSWVWG